MAIIWEWDRCCESSESLDWFDLIQSNRLFPRSKVIVAIWYLSSDKIWYKIQATSKVKWNRKVLWKGNPWNLNHDFSTVPRAMPYINISNFYVFQLYWNNFVLIKVTWYLRKVINTYKLLQLNVKKWAFFLRIYFVHFMRLYF